MAPIATFHFLPGFLLLCDVCGCFCAGSSAGRGSCREGLGSCRGGRGCCRGSYRGGHSSGGSAGSGRVGGVRGDVRGCCCGCCAGCIHGGCDDCGRFGGTRPESPDPPTVTACLQTPD